MLEFENEFLNSEEASKQKSYEDRYSMQKWWHQNSTLCLYSVCVYIINVPHNVIEIVFSVRMLCSYDVMSHFAVFVLKRNDTAKYYLIFIHWHDKSFNFTILVPIFYVFIYLQLCTYIMIKTVIHSFRYLVDSFWFHIHSSVYLFVCGDKEEIATDELVEKFI